MLSVVHNLAAMTAQRQFQLNNFSKAKTTEKLSSGYRINRSADDAAGLCISEKMRFLIRGLRQGVDNGEDGVSFVQTADGALEETTEIVRRMNTLSIKALNGTNSASDREAIDSEFQALKEELNRISQTTKFNDQRIFEDQESPSATLKGTTVWEPNQMHIITEGSNDLSFTYTTDKESNKTGSIKIPAGEYTTQELLEQIDDALFQSNLWKDGLYIEHTDDGTINLKVEPGTEIGTIGGGLKYLFLDTYENSNLGALIGTTVFPNENSRLEIVKDGNDTLSFSIVNMKDGGTSNVSLKIPAGNYKKSEIIDYLNTQLAGTSVSASSYGTGIKLSSGDSIVTEFHGNMFQIDTVGTIKHSVFYDNIKYANIELTPSYVKSVGVLSTNAKDDEYLKFHINSTNNTLTFNDVNEESGSATITIPDGDYSAAEMARKINELITADSYLNGKLTASTNREAAVIYGSTQYFDGITLTSTQLGRHSDVGLDTGSSAYATLFTDRKYNTYSSSQFYQYSAYSSASYSYVTGAKEFASSDFPLTISAGINDQFKLVMENSNSTTYPITIAAGTYTSLESVRDALNDAFNDSSAPDQYKGKVSAVIYNNKLRIRSNNGYAINNINISAVTGNNGYRDLFTSTTANNLKSQSGVLLLDTPASDAQINAITAADRYMTINVLNSSGNSVKQSYTIDLFDGGSFATRDSITNAINNAISAQTTTTTNTSYFNSTSGKTTYNTNRYQYTAGKTVETEGVLGFDYNSGAIATFNISDPNNIEITTSSRYLNIKINNVSKRLELPTGVYSISSLASALQSQIDEKYGTNLGGAVVSYTPSGQLKFTARVDKADGSGDVRGTTTSISFIDSSMYQELISEKTAGYRSAYSRPIKDTITVDSSSNQYSFYYYKDNNYVSGTVTLEDGTYNRSTFVSMFNRVLAQDSNLNGLEVSLNNDNTLKYSTKKKGSGNYLSSNPSGNANKAMYGTTTVTTPDVNANFIDMGNGTYKLNLTASGGTYNYFSVPSDKASIFQSLSSSSVTPTYTATQTSYLRSTPFSSPITIDNYNNDLSLDFYDYGTRKNVNIQLDNGSYTGDQLATALQNKLNTATGKDSFVVEYDAGNTLKIRTYLSGSYYRFDSNISGGFYDRVLCRATPHSDTYAALSDVGSQSSDSCYAVGRMNIRDAETEIVQGVNDTLSFKYAVNGTREEISLKLDSGLYNGDDLVSMIQGKLQQELVNHGHPSDFIEASLGGIGTPGSMDDNALVLKLNQNYDLALGEHIIDSIGGTAAFGVFYKVDGKIQVGYLMGAKDLTNDITIGSGENRFSFDVDGTTYSIDIPSNTYTKQELSDTINQLFENNNIPAAVEIKNGHLKLNNNNYGRHVIENVTGPCADIIFYDIDNFDDDHDTRIVMSSEGNRDSIDIHRYAMNKSNLRLANANVTTEEAAARAANKTDYALTKISAIRSNYGAMQNRLEHSISNHNNTMENTQSAESLIRDANMANESFRFAMLNILTQAGSAMLVQANQQPQQILRLLQ